MRSYALSRSHILGDSCASHGNYIVRRIKLSISGLGHHIRLNSLTLERRAPRSKHGRQVDSSSRVYGRGWPECGRYPVTDGVRRRLSIAEETSVITTCVSGTIAGNWARRCSPRPKTRRHRNSQVVLSSRFFGVGLPL
jgi:hypothetical protein